MAEVDGVSTSRRDWLVRAREMIAWRWAKDLPQNGAGQVAAHTCLGYLCVALNPAET
jgi:hypothetical protein